MSREPAFGTALFDADASGKRLMHNDLALTLVRTLADYMGDLEIWLEELMERNVIDSLIIATTNFYIKFLLTKADINNSKESSFKDSRVAIVQMKENIGVIREYFESLIKVFPALGRTKRRLFHQSYQWNGRGGNGLHYTQRNHNQEWGHRLQCKTRTRPTDD